MVDEPEDYLSKLNKLVKQTQPARDLIDRLGPSFVQNALEKASTASTLYEQFAKFTNTQLPGVEDSAAEFVKRFIQPSMLEQAADKANLVTRSFGSKVLEDFENRAQLKDAFAFAETIKLAFPDDLLARASREVEFFKGLDNLKLPSGIEAEIVKWQEDRKAFIGPIDDLRATGLLDLAPSDSAFASAAIALSSYEQHFQLPDDGMLSKFMKGIEATKLSNIPLLDLAGRMSAPWLDTLNPTGSISAFADLQVMGLTLQSHQAFADETSELLRRHLGDWRDPVTLPELASGAILARSEFYATRGFRRELTDFPPDAFSEIIDISGFTGEPPGPSEIYGDPLSDSDEEDLSAFARTNEAYRQLLRFEARLRRFIDRVLTQEFGPDWPKHQLPADMYPKWVESQQKAENAGRAKGRLIDYADFTHYILIIQKKNLWPLFQSRGFKIESVRESFSRLAWPRVEIAHARPISQDDQLLLYVEIKRLGRAFGL